MKKSCLMDQTLQLPPIGTPVVIDDEADGTGHPGVVSGHGQNTRAGALVDPSTPLVPVVLVTLDQGVMLSDNEGQQRCFVQVIAVHPDNLADWQ